METFIKTLWLLVVGLLIVVIISTAVALPVMWMVNYLFTTSVIAFLFGTAQLSFWQAYWLAVLCASLFKGSTTTLAANKEKS